VPPFEIWVDVDEKLPPDVAISFARFPLPFAVIRMQAPCRPEAARTKLKQALLTYTQVMNPFRYRRYRGKLSGIVGHRYFTVGRVLYYTVWLPVMVGLISQEGSGVKVTLLFLYLGPTVVAAAFILMFGLMIQVYFSPVSFVPIVFAAWLYAIHWSPYYGEVLRTTRELHALLCGPEIQDSP
jgi:hypothetical protein